MLLYVFDMFHILLSGDSLRDLWNAYMYVCMYVYMQWTYSVSVIKTRKLMLYREIIAAFSEIQNKLIKSVSRM